MVQLAAPLGGGRGAPYERFWNRWIERVQAEHPEWSNAHVPQRQSWITTPSPAKGSVIGNSFAINGRLRSEPYIDAADTAGNLVVLNALQTSSDQLHKADGRELTWEPLPGYRAPHTNRSTLASRSTASASFGPAIFSSYPAPMACPKPRPRRPLPRQRHPDTGTADRPVRQTQPFEPVGRCARRNAPCLVTPDREYYGLEVHQRTGIDKGTLYLLLNKLARAGWLASRPEDEDQRRVGARPGKGPGKRRTYYQLTPDGHRAAQREITNRALPPEQTP